MPTRSITAGLRVPRGRVRLADRDPSATPGCEGGKREAEEALLALAPALSDLQERLYANGWHGGKRSLLLVLQGMDTAGKAGVMRNAVGLFDPQGVHIKAFKEPTPEERRHDFLWRVVKEVPAAGMIGIFDRSHYEDVLIARVHKIAPAKEIERRYGAINDFEKRLAEDRTVILKCMLHISPEEQKKRLMERLTDPTKYWKYNAADVDERSHWDEYMAAYAVALSRCNTDAAPWYVVPADRKWYRNWAVAHLVWETLDELDPKYPEPEFDPVAELARLRAAK
jgi:PPK2 family polyphosphate:nucleotide phosphotransferase